MKLALCFLGCLITGARSFGLKENWSILQASSWRVAMGPWNCPGPHWPVGNICRRGVRRQLRCWWRGMWKPCENEDSTGFWMGGRPMMLEARHGLGIQQLLNPVRESHHCFKLEIYYRTSPISAQMRILGSSLQNGYQSEGKGIAGGVACCAKWSL